MLYSVTLTLIVKFEHFLVMHLVMTADDSLLWQIFCRAPIISRLSLLGGEFITTETM